MAKQSFTYSGDAKTRLKAIKRAKKEGMIFSQLVEKLLSAYNSAEFYKTLDTPSKQFTSVIQLKHE